MSFNSVEYWRNRKATYGFCNTSKTELGEVDRKFIETYLKTNQYILDYGVGDGKLFPLYEKYNSDVVGFDIVNYYDLQPIRKFPYKNLVSDSIRQLIEFKDNEFDLCCCINTIAHVEPQYIDIVLLDIKRVSKTAIFTAYENFDEYNKQFDKHCFNYNYTEILRRNNIELKYYLNKNNISFFEI